MFLLFVYSALQSCGDPHRVELKMRSLFSVDAMRWLRMACFACLLTCMCISLPSHAIACPNCKDAVTDNDPSGNNLARGYFYSILIMLGMPATLAGSFGMYVWREMLKQRSVAAEQNRSDSLPSA
jgi:ribosomal protein S27E